jgi:hypothetical protein
MRVVSFLATLALVCLAMISRAVAVDASGRTVRWTPGQADSEFAQLADGTYRYGLANGNVVVTLAVDSQELQKSQARVEPFISLFLSVHSSGKETIEFAPRRATLEFKKHYGERHEALDPQGLSQRLQKQLDALRKENARENRKHPKKDETIGALSNQETAISAMIDFLQTRALKPTALSPDLPQISGWLFFDTRSRWIHSLNSQEEFVLRVPLGATTFEFPFLLPPSSADINLRSRPTE